MYDICIKNYKNYLIIKTIYFSSLKVLNKHFKPCVWKFLQVILPFAGFYSE